MKNGLYLAQFAIPSTDGQGWDSQHGVAYIQDGYIVGGDSSHWWQGDIAVTDEALSVNLTIKVHTSRSQSVFGFFEEVQLKVIGVKKGNAWQADGETNVAPGRIMQLNIRPLKGD